MASALPDFIRDCDIVNQRGGTIASRPGNRSYHELLISNSTIYNNLPRDKKEPFVRNVFRFLRYVQERKFFKWIPTSKVYQEIQSEAQIVNQINTAFREDWVKRANINNFWLIGEHRNKNSNFSFAVTSNQGKTWTSVDRDEVRHILESEGPVNLLIIPDCQGYLGQPETFAASTGLVSPQVKTFYQAVTPEDDDKTTAISASTQQTAVLVDRYHDMKRRSRAISFSDDELKDEFAATRAI